MLQQKNRLTRTKDWEILFKEGKFCSGKFLTLKFWKIEPEKYPKRDYTQDDLKIGFAVGLKISKSAVKRNRVKRQMREVVRLLVKDGKIKGGFMIGMLPKPDILEKEYKEIEKDLIEVLSKARLLI